MDDTTSSGELIDRAAPQPAEPAGELSYLCFWPIGNSRNNLVNFLTPRQQRKHSDLFAAALSCKCCCSGPGTWDTCFHNYLTVALNEDLHRKIWNRAVTAATSSLWQQEVLTCERLWGWNHSVYLHNSQKWLTVAAFGRPSQESSVFMASKRSDLLKMPPKCLSPK